MGNLEMSPEKRKQVYKFVELKELIPKLKLCYDKDLKDKFPVCINFYLEVHLTKSPAYLIAYMTNEKRDSWESPQTNIVSYNDFHRLKLVNEIRDTNNLPARVGLTREQYKMFFE